MRLLHQHAGLGRTPFAWWQGKKKSRDDRRVGYEVYDRKCRLQDAWELIGGSGDDTLRMSRVSSSP